MTSENNPTPPTTETDSTDATATAGAPTKKRRWRSLLRTAGILLLLFLTLSAIGVGGAEYYTAQPDFCGSCHIMDPYYNSWHADIHGARLDVRCVDCHYAPGEQHTFKAKFKGLSQAASYFSGRSGGSRPRAHVNDASCLTSKCHGEGGHLDKILMIGEIRTETRIVGGQTTEIERKPTVRFVHAKHRNVEGRIAETETAIASLLTALAAKIDAAALDRIDALARSVGPAESRGQALRAMLREIGAESVESDALELMRLRHMNVRLDQLAGLNCAACHTYDGTGRGHFAVDQQTCFTCHFTNQTFNRDTGSCLTCHEAPTRSIFVHEQAASSPDGATASLMDHGDIIKRGIDCASCHFDVIRGDTQVSARECTHCHDQDRFLADFDSRTTETVAEYHRVHVAAQRARCTDCHRAVQHRLADPIAVGTSTEFLQPVLNDCQHCHPNHHHEQVELLKGVGGHGPTVAMPNAMFGSRVNCRGCHAETGSDMKGDALIEATEQTCIACHSGDYATLFNQWRSEVTSAMEEAHAALARVDAVLEARRADGVVIPKRIEDIVAEARSNIQFIRAGNGIHNKNYAIQLLDYATRGLDDVIVELAE